MRTSTMNHHLSVKILILVYSLVFVPSHGVDYWQATILVGSHCGVRCNALQINTFTMTITATMAMVTNSAAGKQPWIWQDNKSLFIDYKCT